jgi:cyanate permease
MWLLILEALAALALLIFIVWWTMFSGRKKDRSQAQPGKEEDR